MTPYSFDVWHSGFVERVFDGAASELVATLLNTERLPTKELEKIQDLINDAKRRRP